MWTLVALLLFSALCQAKFVEEYQAQSDKEFIHLAKCTVNCVETTLQNSSFWLNLITQVINWDYKDLSLMAVEGTDVEKVNSEDEDLNNISCKEVCLGIIQLLDLKGPAEDLESMSCNELVLWILENINFEEVSLLLVNQPNFHEIIFAYFEQYVKELKHELGHEVVDMLEKINFDTLIFEILSKLRDIDHKFVDEPFRMYWRGELSSMIKNANLNKKLHEIVKCLYSDPATATIKTKQEPSCLVNEEQLAKRILLTLYDMTCNAYGAWETCAAECPELDSNRRVKDIFPIVDVFDFICKEHGEDFMSSLPCFDRCDERCNIGLTYPLEMYTQRKIDAQRHGLTYALGASMNRMCRASSCLVQCQTSHALKNCPGEKGEIASALFKTIAEKTIDGLLKTFKTYLPNAIIAKECEKFVEQQKPALPVKNEF